MIKSITHQLIAGAASACLSTAALLTTPTAWAGNTVSKGGA
jgi:hypothetical protein